MITYSFQEKSVGKYNAVMYTWTYASHNFLNKFSLAEANLVPFSQVFLEQPFCRIHVNSWVVCDLFPRRNKVFSQNQVNWAVMSFYFDLVPPFYFLKWERCFSTFIPVLTWIIYLLITAKSMFEFSN